MATSFDVNLTFTSFVGHRQVKGGSIIGPVPFIQTIHTLEGEDITPLDYPALSFLRVEPLDNFVFQPTTTSSVQTVYLSNIGARALTITNITFTSYDVTPKASGLSYPITIPAYSTSTFNLSYYAETPGRYNNLFIVESNNVTGPYRVLTYQNAGYEFGFRISPTGYTTSTTFPGRVIDFKYDLITTSTDPSNKDVIPTGAVITGSAAWTIIGTGTNFASVRFDPKTVDNVNGTYYSTLTVTSGLISHEVTNTAIINIDHTINRNLSSWLSPVSHDNSVIGVSYDLEYNQRVMTIGVGTSSGALTVVSGNPYIYVSDLGLGRRYSDYNNWAEVYRIPFSTSTTSTVYYSKDYIDKTTTTTNYSSYFGEFESADSMFIVTDDGYGSILVELNNLIIFNTSTVSTSTVRTLHNLTRAFHYYSGIDIDGRYNQILVTVDVNGSTPPNGSGWVLPENSDTMQIQPGWIMQDATGARYTVNSSGHNVLFNGWGIGFASALTIAWPLTFYASPLPLLKDPTTTYLFIGFNYNTRDKTATTATSIVKIPS